MSTPIIAVWRLCRNCGGDGHLGLGNAVCEKCGGEGMTPVGVAGFPKLSWWERVMSALGFV